MPTMRCLIPFHGFMKYTVHDIVSNLYLRLFCIGRISKRRLKQSAAVRMVYFRNMATREPTLFLALYHDDLEVANPLGSRRGVHKLG